VAGGLLLLPATSQAHLVNIGLGPFYDGVPSWDGVQSVLKLEHPLNVAYRQSGTYWEMTFPSAPGG
jgi:hypothetical protein